MCACSTEAGSWLPNSAGQLCPPSQLYDPRNPDLAALLPDACFPAVSFLNDEMALSVLAGQLGLRTLATHDTLLQVSGAGRAAVPARCSQCPAVSACCCP